MTTAIDRALAELRAIPMREPNQPTTPAPASCCTGDRRGYQWHQRTGNLPACDAATHANRIYQRDYEHRTSHTTNAGRRTR